MGAVGLLGGLVHLLQIDHVGRRAVLLHQLVAAPVIAHLFLRQLRDLAVGVVQVAEYQGLRRAGVHELDSTRASRRTVPRRLVPPRVSCAECAGCKRCTSP